jgi:serine/threonine protein kinase
MKTHPLSYQGWDMFSTGLVGNIYHIAPEQIDSNAYSGEKRDIWSLGVILYNMLVGHPPFFASDVSLLLKKIQTVDYLVPVHLSRDASDLISKMLVVNPDERWSLKAIADHTWLTGM